MLAVAGGKGGCGKTTTTLGISRALARAGGTVTAVDADVDMPDLHVVSGTPASPGLDALSAGEPIDACRHAAVEVPGVSIVPAGTGEGGVERGLRRLGQTHDRVVVDTPAGASIDATRPIRIADGVVVVSTPTRESLQDAAKTAELARTVGTPTVGIVLNRSDGSVDPSSMFDCPVLGHLPMVDADRPTSRLRGSFRNIVRAIGKRNT